MQVGMLQNPASMQWSRVLPDQTVEVIKRPGKEGRFVAMAGDGINAVMGNALRLRREHLQRRDS